jgi:hypothetical protein
LIDAKNAREILAAYVERKPSEIAEAIDVLYQEFGTYQAIAQQVGRSEKFWGTRHRIFKLPTGIRWKIDQGQISIEQAYQISRLEKKEDQWILAMVIIEAKNLTTKECGNVVNLVLNENKSIKDVLSISAGVRFDNIQPLLLPLGFDIRLAICKLAWERCQNWEDLAYQLILQGLDVDPEEVASQFEASAAQLLKHAEELRKAGQNNSESYNSPKQKSE